MRVTLASDAKYLASPISYMLVCGLLCVVSYVWSPMCGLLCANSSDLPLSLTDFIKIEGFSGAEDIPYGYVRFEQYLFVICQSASVHQLTCE